VKAGATGEKKKKVSNNTIGVDPQVTKKKARQENLESHLWGQN